MFAIAEAVGRLTNSTHSRDQAQEWWTGKHWSPASNEAKTFDSEADAKAHAESEIDRDYRIFELDD